VDKLELLVFVQWFVSLVCGWWPTLWLACVLCIGVYFVFVCLCVCVLSVRVGVAQRYGVSPLLVTRQEMLQGAMAHEGT